MKKVTVKILVACIAAFIVVLAGFASIAFGLKNIYDMYNNLVVEGIDNTTHMDKIRKLVNAELSVSSFYVLATSDEVIEQYDRQEEAVRAELTECLKEFGQRMRGNEKEHLFHNINSGCVAVFNEISIAMALRQSGSKALAEQYITKNLVRSTNALNKDLEDLGAYIDGELDKARVYMASYSKISAISFAITILIVIATFVAFVFLCFMLTSQLEHNKNTLQLDVKRKAEEITAQNKKIIYIQEQTIYGMANLIESRDSDTGEHVKRTSLYVEILVNAALEVGYHPEIITKEYAELLKKAAPMHDIGKISIPDSILKKPDKLTDEEYRMIQNHTIAGGKIIRDVLSNIESEDYVQIAVDVATSHHERWDGRGYPYQLKGEEIPIGARIMAIADVFDALVSPRCYKDPFSGEESFRIIELAKGTHFDPVLVDLLLKKRSEVIKVLSMA